MIDGRPRTLVSTAELAAHPQWRIVDVRNDVYDPPKGLQAYLADHLPNAVHADLDVALSGIRSGRNGRNPLPDAATFATWLGSQGLHNDDTIVAYDASSGGYAARFWWMLRWVGHLDVAVLEGGYAAWVREGRAVTKAVPAFPASTFVARGVRDTPASSAELLANLRNETLRLVDARATNRFEGRDEIVSPVAGHVPGAINRPFTENIDANGYFKSAAQLRAEFTPLLAGRSPDQIVHSCGSGVVATHNILAMEIAGLTGSRLYPGSWTEWTSDRSRPVATGPEPHV